MQTRYSPTEYLYASARIRALENGLIGKDKISTLLALPTAQDLIAALQAEGIAPKDGGSDIEPALLAFLKQGIDTVKQAVPDAALVHIIEYPYDCHNIKSYLKGTYRGIDPADLMIDAGSVPTKQLLTALDTDDLSLLPKNMAAAVPAAKEAYLRTGDPREIDFLTDRALYQDLKMAAAGFPFAEDLVAARADLTNFMICLRLLRSKNRDLAPLLFERSVLPGGTLDSNFFTGAFETGESELLSKLAISTPYGQVAAGADKLSLAEIEKRADDHIMTLLRKVKYLPFGAEIPLAFLFALETSVKNLRILLAGKKAGLDDSTLRGRVRDSYV